MLTDFEFSILEFSDLYVSRVSRECSTWTFTTEITFFRYWSAAFSLIIRSRKVSFGNVLYWYTIKNSIIEIISSENLSPYSRHIHSHVMKMFFNRIFIEFRFLTLVDLLFTPIAENETKKLNFGFCWKLDSIWIPSWNEIINENCASISLESFIDTFWKIKEIWNNYIRKKSNNDLS